VYRIVRTGMVKCMCCGCRFQEWELHPPEIMFVNGYPAPCPNIGRAHYGNWQFDGKVPFTVCVTEREYIPDVKE
jgi:hypothetical protein